MIRFRSLLVALAAAAALHPARRLGAAGGEIHARLAVRGAGRPLPAAGGQGLLQGRGAGRDDRFGRGLGGRRQPHRHRRLRHGLRGPRGADRVPRQQPAEQDAGRVHGLRDRAGRDLHAQEERHRQAGRPRRQEHRSTSVRRGAEGLADLRQGRGPQDRRRHLAEHGPGAARAAPRARRGAGDLGLLLHGLSQPARARRQARRDRGVQVRRLRREALRQRGDGERAVRHGEPQGTSPASCARSRRAWKRSWPSPTRASPR